MSRSYRKNPVCKETSGNHNSAKFGKRQANRRVRHHTDIPNHGAYKKAYCSWCICDYSFRMTEAELKILWERNDQYPPFAAYLHRKFHTYQQAKMWWKRVYVNK